MVLYARNPDSKVNAEIRDEVAKFAARSRRQPTDDEFLDLENTVREIRAKYSKARAAAGGNDVATDVESIVNAGESARTTWGVSKSIFPPMSVSSVSRSFACVDDREHTIYKVEWRIDQALLGAISVRHKVSVTLASFSYPSLQSTVESGTHLRSLSRSRCPV